MKTLTRVTQSVRSLDPPATTVDRAKAFALALPPDVVFSHVTAAQLWGLPLPLALEAQVVLDVMRPTGRGLVERHGCRGHRGRERRSVVLLRGVAVTSLVDTWVDLGEVVSRGLTLTDLVVAGDVVAGRSGPPSHDPTDRDPPTDPTALMRATLARRVRPRHGRMLGTALTLVRPGVRSPMETRARLMFHHAGFPEPEVNGAIHSRDGGWLAEGDLVWRERRVIGEYQGAVHAGIRARSYDAHRNGLLHDEGWTVLELFAADLDDRARRVVTLRRFATALALDPATLRIG